MLGDPHGMIDGLDEDQAIARLAGVSVHPDEADDLIGILVATDYFQLDHVDVLLGEFQRVVVFLLREAARHTFSIEQRHVAKAGLLQRFDHFPHQGMADIRIDLFHHESLPIWNTGSGSGAPSAVPSGPYRRSRRPSTHRYKAGKTSRVRAVDVMRPPTTTTAKGFCTSDPGPVARSKGTSPRLATRAVMSTGRSRRSAPIRTASSKVKPSCLN